MCTDSETRDYEDTQSRQKKLERSFAGVLFVIVAPIILLTVVCELGIISPPDNILKWSKLPYALTALGTFYGAIGASSPLAVNPTDKVRDKFALFGWVTLIFGSVFALLYGTQMNTEGWTPLR